MNDPKTPDLDDDNLWNEPTDPVADENAEAMRKAYNDMMADDEDDAGGLDSPLDTDKIKDARIAQEKGQDLIEKARLGRSKDDDDMPPPPPDDKTDDKPVDDTAQAAAPDDIAALLDGIDPDRATKISERIGVADKVMGLFKGREDQLKAHGVSAEQAMERLLYLNEFAQQKPDEYLAWVATQMNADSPHEVLGKAAEVLGYKLVKDGEEEDLFEDPEVKRLRQENEALKRSSGQGPTFGPDAPKNALATQLQSFINETGPDGKPLRPHYSRLEPAIVAELKRITETEKRFATMDDLARVYNELAGLGGSSAAAGEKVVAEGDTKAAAAAEKARAASKSIDGTGQGANRRPAPSADASTEEIIRHYAGL